MQSRIVIVGGGIASFATAIFAHELVPGAKIQVLTDLDRERMGGHLASWDENGFAVEHGFHALFGFYEEAKKLLRKVGAFNHFKKSPQHIWIHKAGELNRFAIANPLAYKGFDTREKLALSKFYVRLAQVMADVTLNGPEALVKRDSSDFREWSLEMGMPRTVVDSGFYDQFYAGAFNDPEELSTFVALQSLWGCAQKPWHYYFKKPSREAIMLPLADYFTHQCGGEVLYRHRALKVNFEASVSGAERIRSITVQRDGGETFELEGDLFVSGLGVEDFKTFDFGSIGQTHPYFRNVQKLKGVSSLSLQAWFKHDPVPEAVDAFMTGFSKPFVVICPISRVRGEASHPKYPHELIACGAEGGFEDESDASIIERFIEELRSAGFALKGDLAHGKDAYYVLRRNRSAGHRYLLTRPSEYALRPPTQSPIPNLVLTGAWIRNKWALPCVEATVCSAQEAAKAIAQHADGLRADRYLPTQGDPMPLESLVLPPPYRFPTSRGSFFLLDRDTSYPLRLPPELELVPSLANRCLLSVFKHQNVSCDNDPTRREYGYNEVMLSVFAAPKYGGRRGKAGLLPVVLYLDDDTAVAAGREVYGFPKRWAQVTCEDTGFSIARHGPLLSGKWSGQWEAANPMPGSVHHGWEALTGLLSKIPMVSEWSQEFSESRFGVGLPIYNHLRVLDAEDPKRLAFSKLTSVEMSQLKIARFKVLRSAEFEVHANAQDAVRHFVAHEEGRIRARFGIGLDFSFAME